MKPDLKILIVEDSEAFRESVIQLLGVYMDVEGVANLVSANARLQKENYDVVILDKQLPDGDGMSLIAPLKESSPNTVIIILTEDGEASAAKRCMLLGADDYVVKTSNIVSDLLVRIPFVIERAADSRKLRNLRDQVREAFKYEIIGSSPSTMALREEILMSRGAMSSFLITGESGTGKELIARRINALADGKQRQLVVVNCAAIPPNLIESELFGYQKGAFTGATEDRKGKFELAHEGDIFLDEIGDLPYEAQSKLLRVIQDGQYFRVGGTKPIQVSFRLIAATNRDLEAMVASGEFREDLFYRINVVRLKTAPLRKRPEDVPALATHFSREMGNSRVSISETALKRLAAYSWPGNIRELRNVIERAMLHMQFRAKKAGIAPTSIEAEDISFDKLASDEAMSLESAVPKKLSDLTDENFKAFMRAAEKAYIQSALELASGNAAEAGLRIGLARSTMFTKCAQYEIPRREYNSRRDRPSAELLI